MKRILLILVGLIPLITISQNWTPLNTLPPGYDSRNHPVTFSLNGDGYVLTGNTSDEDFKDFYKYNAANDTWEKLPDFPGSSRGYSYGVTMNNKAYVGFGGFNDPAEQQFVYLKDFWEFDPSNSTWTQLASHPGNGRIHPAMVAVSGKVYVGLGGSASGDLKDWWEYDIASDTWIQKPDLPSTQRHHPYYFGINDEVYVGFGHHQNTIFNDFYKYDPAASTWTSLDDFPGQGRVAGTQFSYDGKGYILSGQGENHQNLSTGEFWEYDSASDQWTALTPHPGSGRWAPGSFVIEDEVFLTSGRSNSGDQKDLMKYSFGELSVPSNVGIEGVLIYPNPAQNIVVIEAPESFISLNISTINGQQLEPVYSKNSNGFILDISGLTAGVYMIKMETNNNQVYYKRVVKL